MLPPLSDKVGSSLQLLVPTKIAPLTVSARRNALLELKKVDEIQVRPADKGKKDWFMVEVFADSATIPEDVELQNETRLRRPTIRVERNLLQFVALRNKVYHIVQDAHNFEHCDFCAGFMDLVVFGANPDGFLVGLLGGKRLARTQAKFVEELLALIVQHIDIDTRGFCSGKTSVPQLVHEFLFTQGSSTA
ncbi:hypothetical protein PHMEG_0002360 [Phytophthora megakarya]|uniref:Uncharacterized protein n=1 Tax=Phytophthora megakarya TaxID=4795 RepID=A0A225X0U2_9STRA|nr:hypothetical protein PHMEG_0002360 [Phytophthora megakarya]